MNQQLQAQQAQFIAALQPGARHLLEFSSEQISVLSAALGELPAKHSVPLLQSITQQVASGLSRSHAKKVPVTGGAAPGPVGETISINGQDVEVARLPPEVVANLRSMTAGGVAAAQAHQEAQVQPADERAGLNQFGE